MGRWTRYWSCTTDVTAYRWLPRSWKAAVFEIVTLVSPQVSHQYLCMIHIYDALSVYFTTNRTSTWGPEFWWMLPLKSWRTKSKTKAIKYPTHTGVDSWAVEVLSNLKEYLTKLKEKSHMFTLGRPSVRSQKHNCPILLPLTIHWN